jgi:hypothetical protein
MLRFGMQSHKLSHNSIHFETQKKFKKHLFKTFTNFEMIIIKFHVKKTILIFYLHLKYMLTYIKGTFFFKNENLFRDHLTCMLSTYNQPHNLVYKHTCTKCTYIHIVLMLTLSIRTF